MKKIAFIAALALLVGAGASQYAYASDGGVRIFSTVPEVLKATAVAYRDFESKLISKSGGSSDLERHIYNIDNYYIKAYAADGLFVVEFTPMPLNGSSLRGGGAKYVIDTKSEEVLKYLEYR